MPSKVDIIMPVFNRWEHTKQSLDSLFANTPEDLYELYIVNDHSDKSTGGLLAEYIFGWAKRKNVHIHTNPVNIGPGASRNLITKMITDSNKRSKYLYHSDNDVFFAKGWLETLLVVYKKNKDTIKLLGAGCHPYLQTSRRVQSEDEDLPPAAWGFAVGIKDAVSGYSQLMSWDVWDKYGPFDESMRNAEKKIMGSEDWAFCQKIVKDGFYVGSLEPELVIATGKTNTYGEPATGSETFRNEPGVMVI